MWQRRLQEFLAKVMPVIAAYIMGPYLDGPADRVSDKTERSECRYEKSWLANQPRSCSSPIYRGRELQSSQLFPPNGAKDRQADRGRAGDDDDERRGKVL